MRPKIRWGSLRTKIIAWSFVPTAMILIAVALLTFSAYERVTEELVIAERIDCAWKLARFPGSYRITLNPLGGKSEYQKVDIVRPNRTP